MQVPSSSYLKLALLGFCKKIILNQMVKRVGCRSAISALLCVTPDGQILGRWVFAVDVTRVWLALRKALELTATLVGCREPW